MLRKNANLVYGERIGSTQADFLSDAAIASASEVLTCFFGVTATPLKAMPGLASMLGVGELFVKDESERLALMSFKAMGGAYAVFRIVHEAAERQLGHPLSYKKLLDPEIRAIAKEITVCCATDGNHGRSVAFGAKLIGCRAVIFLHQGVSQARESAIRELGAETVRVTGSYDDSVDHASRRAAEGGWTVVTDTSWPGNERIPAMVMQGYAVIAAEVAEQMDAPTHIFLQAGVGGFAASVAGFYAMRLGERRPSIVVVEPQRAACLFHSNECGARMATTPGLSTVMAMLECHQPSLIAWNILARVADYFMTVDEDDALWAMRQFAAPVTGDPLIVSGESGGVGLAALHTANSLRYRDILGLDSQSRVLLFNTEGATDPHLYESIVGLAPGRMKASSEPAQ